MAENDASSPIWDNGQWKNTKADVDGTASHCSSTVTRCPAPSGDEGEDTRSGHGSGSGSNGRSRAGETNKTQDTWSRDDVSSSGDGQRSETTPEDGAGAANFASLQRDGPSASCGSTGHPEQCKPCAFYCYSLRGCRNGDGCVFCHLFHESKLQQRREEWKRAQREKRGRMRKNAREEAQASVVASQAVESTPAPAQPTLIHHTAKVKPTFLQGVSATMEDQEERPVAKVAYVREGEPAKELSVGAQQSPFRKNAAAAAVKAGAAGTAPGTSLGGQKKQKKPLKPQKPAAQDSLGTPMHVPALFDTMNPMTNPMAVPGMTNGMNGNMPMDFFSYTPSSVVVGVGQAVELWPPVPILSAGMLFAVSPALPRGLALDKNTGLIAGTAQEGTDGSKQYFVTACNPRAVVPSIRVSMVDIKVINVQAPGYTMSSLVQPEPGVTVVTLREDPNAPNPAMGTAEMLQSIMAQQYPQASTIAKLSALVAQQEQVCNMLGGRPLPHPSRQWWEQIAGGCSSTS